MDVNTKYWKMFYNGVLMMTGNEMGPRTDLELIIIIIILIFDLIYSGNIFGNVAFLVQMGNRKSSQFQN